MGDETYVKEHLVQVHKPDGSIDPEGLSKLRADPVLMAATERNFRVVVCNENGPEFDSLARDIAEAKRERVRSDTAAPNEVIASLRANPETVQEYKTLFKALGEPTSCDVPMSALPTPATFAAMPSPDKMRS